VVTIVVISVTICSVWLQRWGYQWNDNKRMWCWQW